VTLAIRADPETCAALRALGEWLLVHCDKGWAIDEREHWRVVPAPCARCRALAAALSRVSTAQVPADLLDGC